MTKQFFIEYIKQVKEIVDINNRLCDSIGVCENDFDKPIDRLLGICVDDLEETFGFGDMVDIGEIFFAWWDKCITNNSDTVSIKIDNNEFHAKTTEEFYDMLCNVEPLILNVVPQYIEYDTTNV